VRAFVSFEASSSFDFGEDSLIGDMSRREESALVIIESFRSLLITELDSTLVCKFSIVEGSNFCGVHELFMNDENFGPAWSSCFVKTGLMAG